MERFLLWVFQTIFQVWLQIIWFIFKFTFNLTINLLGWVFGGFSSTFNGYSQIKNINVLVLGSGETLKPNLQFNELFDYSQTANNNEMGGLITNGNMQNGDFWVGT